MRKNKKIEDSIHKQVAMYLKLQYPKIIFRTDFAAGIKLTIGQAVKHNSLQSVASYPDLFIAHPSKGFHGLYIELKKELSDIYKKDMSLKNNKHIHAQHKMLLRLTGLGYKAVFACGFDHAKKIIDEYLKP